MCSQRCEFLKLAVCVKTVVSCHSRETIKLMTKRRGRVERDLAAQGERPRIIFFDQSMTPGALRSVVKESLGNLRGDNVAGDDGC